MPHHISQDPKQATAVTNNIKGDRRAAAASLQLPQNPQGRERGRPDGYAANLPPSQKKLSLACSLSCTCSKIYYLRIIVERMQTLSFSIVIADYLEKFFGASAGQGAGQGELRDITLE
jgi:hypothetical protein